MMAKQKNPIENFDGRVDADFSADSPISIPRIREARDMVYSGTTDLGSEYTEQGPQQSSAPRNRKSTRRKISPFNIIVILFGVAVVSVLYISNILAVGRLVVQIDQLQKQHQQMMNDQELLKAHINRLSAIDRIQDIAQTQLGLRLSKQIPASVTVQPERVQEIDEYVRTQTAQQP